MQWGSVSEFVAMGGYGLYVWTSFGLTALCMLWEVLSLRRRYAAAKTGNDESLRDRCMEPR
jgi:heme exporter protein D